MRTARLFDAESAIYSRTLPELLDVRLMAMSPQAFTLTGFERIAGTDYAQSWLVSKLRSRRVGLILFGRVAPAIQRDGPTSAPLAVAQTSWMVTQPARPKCIVKAT